MRNKALVINIISYIILYHIVFEGLIIFIYQLDDIFTPLGRFVRKYLFHQKLFTEHKKAEFYIFLFNLFISVILFYIANKWYKKENSFKTFWRLVFSFIIINIFIIIYFLIAGIGISTIPAYVLYFLVPITIIMVLILPLMELNYKIFKINKV